MASNFFVWNKSASRLAIAFVIWVLRLYSQNAQLLDVTPIGATSAEGSSINRLGWIGGTAVADVSFAFRYSPAAGSVQLGVTGPRFRPILEDSRAVASINDQGSVVANFPTLGSAIYPVSGGSQILPIQLAYGINNAGQVSGFSFVSNSSALIANIYTPGLGLREIPPRPGVPSTAAHGINQLGVATGFTGYYEIGFIDAAIFPAAGPPQTLGPLSLGRSSMGFAINDFSQVAGVGYRDSGLSESSAVLWSPGAGPVDVGAQTGYSHSVLSAVNGYGQAIGWAAINSASDDSRAFLYTPGLPLLWLSTLALPPGTIIETARGLNDYSQITGRMKTNAGRRAFKLSLPCNLALSNRWVQASAAGGVGLINVTAGQECPWAPKSVTPWVQLQSGGHIGSGSIVFTVTPNSGGPRSAALNVAGYSVQIMQSGTAAVQTFADVPLSDPVFDYIEMLRILGTTNGCSTTPVAFCPSRPLTRAEAAVFIVRALLKTDNFAYPTTPYFDDIPPAHFAFRHIQKLRELGITSGCSLTPAKFCGESALTRTHAAVLLMRAKYGRIIPSTGEASFGDIDSAAYSFIRKMQDMSITAGCSANTFCGDSAMTRAHFAVFLVRTLYTDLGLFER